MVMRSTSEDQTKNTLLTTEDIQMTADLTTEDQVKQLMESSKSENEWNSNCDKIKKDNNGYPDFW